MKILYYFGDDSTYMSKWQFVHFIDELTRHQVNVDIFNPLKFSCIDEANERLIDTLKRNKGYDCFMNCCPSTQLYKETMKEIAKNDIPKLLICFDNLHAPFLHKDIMPYFDLVWLTSRENEDKIIKWGTNTIFLPYAANPYKFVASNRNIDVQKVCFIGSPYGTRCLKINDLAENKVHCDVYYGGRQKKQTTIDRSHYNSDEVVIKLKNYLYSSIGRKLLFSNLMAKIYKPQLFANNSFLQIHNSLDFNEMIEKYHEYALSLNITEVWNSCLLKHPVYKLHLRTFEIPMCGGIEFTTYNDEIASYFEEGKEIVFYRTKEEYVDKALFYLADNRQILRNEIKKAAYKRAVNEHTWWNRFSIIFDKLGLHI